MPAQRSLTSLPAPSRKFLCLLVGLLVGLAALAYWLAWPLVRSLPAAPVPGAAGIVATWLPDDANTGGLGIGDILGLEQAGAFRPMPAPETLPVLNARQRDGRWYAFRIRPGADGGSGRAVLDLVWQNYDRATLYQRGEDGSWRVTVTGERAARDDARRSQRRMAFDLSLEPGETRTWYLHVEDYTRLPTYFQFWPNQDDFLRWERFEYIKIIGFFCLLVPLAAYGLFAYATLHQQGHLYFVWIVLLSAAYRFLVNPMSGEVLPWLASPWQEMATGAVGMLINICYCRFARSFLALKAKSPGWDRCLARLQRGLLASVVLLPFPLWPGTAFTTLMIVNVISTAVYLVLLSAGLSRWKAGTEQAPFFVLAMVLLLVGRGQFLVKGPDVLVRYDEQTFISMLCLAVALMVLAMAKAYRHRLVLIEHLALRSDYTERLENDVTERTRVLQSLSERLAATVAERDRILAVVGHDLRGPAGALQSLTGILAEDARSFSPEQLTELSEEINQACRLQLELLNNLLVWGGVQAGHGRKPVPLEVGAVVADAWKPLASLAAGKRITLSAACPPGLCVMADPALAQTILRNLLANSIKFTRPGGHIEIEGRLLGSGLVEVKVRDDGVGMDPERLRSLFEGLVESSPGTGREKGAGLGLSLCRDLARSAGGDIWLESEPGRGTTAWVTLPAA